MEDLLCQSNQITSLDLTENPNIEFLYCDNNPLSSLDMSQNYKLERLYCNSNQLTSLNIKNVNNHNLFDLQTLNNTSLTCITVDNINYAYIQTYNSSFSWCKDQWTGYNENIGDECILGIAELDNVEINMYPNPLNDILNISSNYKLKSAQIFNAMGQKVFSEENLNTPQINVSNLNSGVYFLKLTDDQNNNTVKRFNKE